MSITLQPLSLGQFHSMATEWNGFLRASNHDSPFLSWEWLTTWWDAFGAPHREPWFRVARDSQGRLQGLFPWMRVAARGRGPVTLRTLQATGRGVEGYAGGSEYSTFLTPALAPGGEAATVQALWAYLEATRREWDVVYLDNLLEGHPSTTALQAHLEERALSRCRFQETNYALRLPTTYDEFLAALTTGQRSGLRRRSRMMESTWRVEVVSLASEADIEPFLADYYEIVRRRHGWAPSAAKARFMRQLCAAFLRAGWLRFSLLRLDGRPVATSFGFAYGGRYHQYKAAFDPDPAFAKVGPGVYLRCKVAEASIGEGLAELNYLIGAYDYKREWSNVQRRLQVATAYGHRLSTLLRVGAQRGVGLLRRLRPHAPAHPAGPETTTRTED